MKPTISNIAYRMYKHAADDLMAVAPDETTRLALQRMQEGKPTAATDLGSFTANRMIHGGVLGALAGGVGGAGLQWLRRDNNKRRKQPSMLLGAILGAGAGGLAGSVGGVMDTPRAAYNADMGEGLGNIRALDYWSQLPGVLLAGHGSVDRGMEAPGPSSFQKMLARLATEAANRKWQPILGHPLDLGEDVGAYIH